MNNLISIVQKQLILLFVLFLLLPVQNMFAQKNPQDDKIISLAGEWKIKLDNNNSGIQENWYLENFTDVTTLPGSCVKNGYGNDISLDAQWTGDIIDKSWYTDAKYEKYRKPGTIKMPFWLNPVKRYVGQVWYQKSIHIPENWQGKRIVLSLERCHWETKLWIDDHYVDMQNSLSTPHYFDLSEYITKAHHKITLCVDNRIKINIGQNSHSISDHTQTNWNGVIGKMQLIATDKVWLEDVQIYPDVKGKQAKITVRIGNITGNTVNVQLTIKARTTDTSPSSHVVSGETVDINVKNNLQTTDIIYYFGDDVKLWDELTPNLYDLTLTLKSDKAFDSRTITFGMRDFSTQGTQFIINGRKTFLRGTLECCIFPLTGYPPTDVESWINVLKTAKAHGLNHIRFHSWCPPDAAFTAADQLGFFYQIECGVWANQGTSIGDGLEVDRFIRDESDRILKEFGNHPSFCLMAYGNEPAGENQKEYLGELVTYWKNKDPRHLYTGAAAWPLIDENQYHNIPEPRIQAWGAGLTSRVNSSAHETETNYSDIIEKHSIPVISHEIGQWCVYPDFSEIDRYTGVLRAYNFEIARDGLQENGMLHQAEDFLMASGKLQALLYKEEIESALRTPNFGGFQLLDLHDFPGQGTALVGVLNAFWGEKGYITPEQFRQFCSTTVPLVICEKFTWTNDENFKAIAKIAHFGAQSIFNAKPIWSVYKGKELVLSGEFEKQNIPIGNEHALGDISFPLGQLSAPSRYTLLISLENTTIENSWDFWVYPKKRAPIDNKDIYISHTPDNLTKNALEAGKTVLLLIKPDNVAGDVPQGFSSIFWNTAWTNRQAPHTLGILCDPSHPLFAEFPTDFHSNWQWWDINVHSKSMILSQLPHELTPIIQVIDDWNTNRKLGLLFEARIGKGKILVCSIDFNDNIKNRPVSKQLEYSLFNYINSPQFQPKTNISFDKLKSLIKS